jgi:ferritin-like metal-binding protein YciE
MQASQPSALPRTAKAQSVALQRAFTKHHRETESHVERLERICKTFGVAARGKKCKGVEGLIDEGKEILEEDASRK